MQIFDGKLFICRQQSQVPKVKLAERITALQQIVSPFGKVDSLLQLLH